MPELIPDRHPESGARDVEVTRVAAVFRIAGYPEQVCQSLAGLCTNWVPDDVWRAGMESLLG